MCLIGLAVQGIHKKENLLVSEDLLGINRIYIFWQKKTGAKRINVVSEDIQKNDWTFRHIIIYIVFGVLVSEELLDSYICLGRPQKESLSYSK